MKYFSEDTVKQILGDYDEDTGGLHNSLSDYDSIDLPDEHGRLIDAAKVKDELAKLGSGQRKWFFAEVGLLIDEAETVLEGNRPTVKTIEHDGMKFRAVEGLCKDCYFADKAFCPDCEDFQIWVKEDAIKVCNHRPSVWQTETPAKGGWYLLKVMHEDEIVYDANLLEDNTDDLQWRYVMSTHGKVIAYKEIEP